VTDVFSAERPYAKCNDCEQVLITPEDAQQHGEDTMTPVEGEGAIKARGHSRHVLNPTREQVVASMVDYAVERAMESFFNDIDNDVHRGRLTTEEVTKALRGWPDFSDGWEEWVREGEEDG
jgi:hypothetical protein